MGLFGGVYKDTIMGRSCISRILQGSQGHLPTVAKVLDAEVAELFGDCAAGLSYVTMHCGSATPHEFCLQFFQKHDHL